MDRNISMVMLLNLMVNFMLLMGTNRLCGGPALPHRAALGGALASVYAGTCLGARCGFLCSFPWRCAALLLAGLVTFGMERTSCRRCAIFVLLNLAMSGMVNWLGSHDLWSVTGAGAVLCLLVILALRGKTSYATVELWHQGKHITVTALQDTGNTLRDPITGGPVLVVDSVTAEMLTGLSAGQLQRPVETMGAIPGLRLIPYRAVGTPNGLLLAIRLQQVRIGSWQGSRVVALAPGELSVHGEYQALTGGI